MESESETCDATYGTGRGTTTTRLHDGEVQRATPAGLSFAVAKQAAHWRARHGNACHAVPSCRQSGRATRPPPSGGCPVEVPQLLAVGADQQPGLVPVLDPALSVRLPEQDVLHDLSVGHVEGQQVVGGPVR